MLPALPPSGQSRLARFRRDEDGSLMIFALVLFLLMVMIGGVALDMMRYETKRTALMNALDRGTLAAASLTQELGAEAVVRDYAEKAGFGEDLQEVIIDSNLNGTTVTAKGIVDTKPIFLHMVGIDDFDARGVSTAEQRISNVEIVLVLDVSGSMAGAKIANLRTAAQDFVQTVLESDTENRISISVVPYNAQVNLGAPLRAKFNVSHLSGVTGADCIELPGSAFGSAGLSRTLALPQAAHADVSNSTSASTSYVAWNNTSYATKIASAPFCRTAQENIVRLPSNNITTLKSQIGALTAGGNTSITLGMKWGLALLDPSARSLYSEFIAAGSIPQAFTGRPFDYDDTESHKIIVLMTDGEHVAHDRINDAYKAGTSPIWRSTGDGNYSIRFTSGRPAAASTREYWVPHLCTSTSCRNGTNTSEAWRAAAWNSGSGVTQQSWQQVWAAQRLTWVAWQLYARALGTSSGTRSTVYYDTIDTLSSTWASVAGMNSSLQSSCAQAKNSGVTVYGIAFEAPANGQAQIAACATSESYYFEADGAEILTDFRTIAASITQLRLTQ